MSAQGDRGVFLTTSTFSSGAIAEAQKVAARIELVDGTRLAQLMLRHGVGVQEKTRVVLHEIDEDFFDSVSGPGCWCLREEVRSFTPRRSGREDTPEIRRSR